MLLLKGPVETVVLLLKGQCRDCCVVVEGSL